MSSRGKDTGSPESGPESTEALRRLLADAVSDIEPGDRLAAIRHETKKVSSMDARRPWIYAVAGAVVATAATVTAVAVVTDNDAPSSQQPGPATSQSVDGEDPSPSPDASGNPDGPDAPDDQGEPGTWVAVPVYYLGEGPRGPVLFREFHDVALSGPDDAEARFRAALTEAVATDPSDPDYRRLWPEGVQLADRMPGDVSEDLLTVRLRSGDTDVRLRPEGMSEREAELSVQALVYTAQASVGAGRLPVQILLNGEHIDMVFGVPTAEALANADVLDTLSLMNITNPQEGEVVSGTFTANGVNNGFEAWFGWEIVDGAGTVVKEGFGMADGAYEEKLFAWQTEEIDVSDLAPGTYTFHAFNDDPSGGAEGNGPHRDTRTIVIE